MTNKMAPYVKVEDGIVYSATTEDITSCKCYFSA